MIKRILGTVLAVGILVMVNAETGQASSPKVTEGRNALFNNGSPTVSGIMTADTAFAEAVQNDPTDLDAHFFAAITRVLASSLSKSPTSLGLHSIRDLLESFGFARNSNNDLAIDSPYDAPLEIDGMYNPPPTIPSATKVTDFLGGPLMTIVDASIADLDLIISSTSSFEVELTTSETGGILPIQIDLGDVLTLKALLCTIKAQALIFSAWDMDDVDLRQTCILNNAGVFQLQRDLLDKYTKLMKLKTTSAATMALAKDALIMAINSSQAAFDFISNEADDQSDDLFTFADQQEMDEAQATLGTLDEVKNSINENRAAIVGEEQWSWWDENWKYHKISIKRDSTGAIVSGTTGRGFTIDSTVSEITSTTFNITASLAGTCPGSVQISGTLDGTMITSLTSSGTDCVGTMEYETYSSINEGGIDNEDSLFDFSVLLGTNGRAPVEIRSHLPTFLADNELLDSSITDPTYGGLWPNWTHENKESPTIPIATITIDGLDSDWFAIPDLGPGWSPDETIPANFDIQTVSVAIDDDYLYWMIKTAAPPPTEAVGVWLTLAEEDENGRTELFADFSQDESGSASYSLSISTFDTFGDTVELPTSIDDVKIGAVTEGRIQRNYLSNFNSPGLIAEIMQWEDPFAFDYWESYTPVLMPTPPVTVSGNIEYNPQTPGISAGQSFVAAYNGPDPQSSDILGSAIVDGVGSYSIPDLPAGSPIYLFAFGDTDNNGVNNWGDYVGTATFTPSPSNATIDIAITRTTPPSTSIVTTIQPGWNLLSSPIGFNVPATMGQAKDSITSAWKWQGDKWAVYINVEEDGGKGYAASKGFEFLEEINPGEGFWLNSPSQTAFTAGLTGVPDFGPLALANGWNLVGLKCDFPTSVATICNENSGIVSIWKWDNGKWSVALPGEEIPGAYAASKGFGNLTTIKPGEGFWVNR